MFTSLSKQFSNLVMNDNGQSQFVFVAEARDWHRIADLDRDCAGTGKEGPFRQDGIGSHKGDGDDRHPCLDGQEHGAALEGLKRPVRRPGPFWKDEDGGAGFDPFCRLLQAFYRFSAVTAIDGNGPGIGHGPSQKRNFEQFFFGQPAEAEGKVALEAEDVKLAEMVGTVDIAGLWLKFLCPFDDHPYSGNLAKQPGPLAGKALQPVFGEMKEKNGNENDQTVINGHKRGKEE